jgi:hypothetical protein
VADRSEGHIEHEVHAHPEARSGVDGDDGEPEPTERVLPARKRAAAPVQVRERREASID